MHKSFAVAALLSGFLVQAAQAQEQKPFSVEDLVRLDRVSDPQVSPDGRYVAFTVTKPTWTPTSAAQTSGSSISIPRRSSRAA